PSRHWNRDSARKIRRLARRGVKTTADLIDHLPHLSADMKSFGIWLLARLKARQAVPVLLKLLSDNAVRAECADVYVIGSLCCGSVAQRSPRSSLSGLEASLRKLREIAANDHRLAPGCWWPMSAEAEDVIHCIETGQWLSPDAAERWPADGERGEWERD
ncbi:MAG TPA: hypothetical protein VGX76_02580, partial [Pirellulales bacterium]|nr:hypothetical protein [Pirellulales bacterium]